MLSDSAPTVECWHPDGLAAFRGSMLSASLTVKFALLTLERDFSDLYCLFINVHAFFYWLVHSFLVDM